MSTFKLYFVKLLNLGWENDLVVKALALQAAKCEDQSSNLCNPWKSHCGVVVPY